METRRTFLAGLLLTGVSSATLGGKTNAQSPVIRPPSQKGPPGQQPDADTPDLPNADKKILESNDKDMKKKVDRLYQLATELKDEVEKTDSSKVLSLNLMKKAEEIERLARDIKNRSKG
jgi:hypothetical protein